MKNQDKRTGASRVDVQEYKESAKEVDVPVHRPEAHPSRRHGKEPHIHVGPVDRILVKPEEGVSRQTFHVTSELRGKLLEDVLGVLSRYSSSMLLVVRDELGLDETGVSLLLKLQPCLQEEKRTSTWPGTVILDEQATAYRYAMNDFVLGEIVSSVSGLYDFQQPAFPEDLSFFREDGTAILSSVSHEHDAYLDLSDEEYKVIIDKLPSLVGILRATSYSLKPEND